MKFLGGLQIQEGITDRHIFYSDFVAPSKNKFSVTTALCIS